MVAVIGAIIVLVATIFVGATVITALGAAAAGEELPKERTKFSTGQPIKGGPIRLVLVADPYSRF